MKLECVKETFIIKRAFENQNYNSIKNQVKWVTKKAEDISQKTKQIDKEMEETRKDKIRGVVQEIPWSTDLLIGALKGRTKKM